MHNIDGPISDRLRQDFPADAPGWRLPTSQPVIVRRKTWRNLWLSGKLRGIESNTDHRRQS